MNKLRDAIINAETIELDGYNFKVFPFGERGQWLDYELLREVTDELSVSIDKNFQDFDYIISPEPGGHLWGSLVALNLKKDINILRLNPSGDDNEIEIFRKTAYNNNRLYFSKFKKGDKVLLVDDVISSGSTLKSIIEILIDQQINVAGVQVILARTNKYKEIAAKYQIPIHFLEAIDLK